MINYTVRVVQGQKSHLIKKRTNNEVSFGGGGGGGGRMSHIPLGQTAVFVEDRQQFCVRYVRCLVVRCRDRCAVVFVAVSCRARDYFSFGAVRTVTVLKHTQ